MWHPIMHARQWFQRWRAEWRELSELLAEVNLSMEQSIELADEAIAHCQEVGARVDEMLAWGRHGRS